MIQQKIVFFENYTKTLKKNTDSFNQMNEKETKENPNETKQSKNVSENYTNINEADSTNLRRNQTERINQLITNEDLIETVCKIDEINTENNSIEQNQNQTRTRRINNQSVITKLDAKSRREQYKLSRNSDKFAIIITSISEVLDIYQDDNDFNDLYISVCDENDNSNQSTTTACIIRELIATEENYGEGLNKVLLYKQYLEQYLPVDIKQPVINDIFCNIEEIYKKSQKFLKILKRRTDISNVNSAFIQSESMLDLYVDYVRNKPVSDIVYDKYEILIKNKQEELQDSLDLASYLLTPIQRLGKYILLLERIENDLIKRNETFNYVRSNIDKIKKIMRLTNDYLIVDLIKKCPNQLNLTAQGSFILKETFILHKPLSIPEVVACLFENVIVFTLPDKHCQQLLYMKHIFLQELKLIYCTEDELIFTLQKDTKDKNIDETMSRFVLEAANQGIRKRWIEIVEKILWEQLKQAKAESLKRLSMKPYSEEAVEYIQNCKPLKVLMEEIRCKSANSRYRNQTIK